MKRIAQTIAVLALVGGALAGPEWIEGAADTEDAGPLPGSAQETKSDDGQLTRIAGRLEGEVLGLGQTVEDFEDMYLIFIDDPVAFSATTVLNQGGSADFDSQLYLFDLEGHGLLGNDNDATGGGGSTITNIATDGTGFVLNDAGLYYLAVTVTGRDPASVGGSIFDFDGDPGQAAAASGVCGGDPTNLLYPLDGTYMLVDFFGDGPTGSGAAQGPDQHNDDDSAGLVLPFTFDLYGDLYTSCFVNNNGNLSFGTLFSAFTASGFPVAGFPMIAPFWGDVDTGNPSNPVGDVWMKLIDSNFDAQDDTLVVTWDNVGYFDENGGLLNTFQVAISDGTNPVIGLGNNVAFSYDNMCWTTGDASGGDGGFFGTPATAGANRGDGIDFFQIGRFDHPGTDYDGPDGNPDGVDFLDGQIFLFSTATTTTNVDPVAVDFPPGNTVTVDALAGETLDLTVQFIGPEGNQTVSVVVTDVDGAGQFGLQVGTQSGNPASVDLDWSPGCGDAGEYVLDFTATDDFNPPGQSVTSLTIVVECDNTEVSGPDGPGADDPVTEWAGEPDPVNDGNYLVFLTGVRAATATGVPVDIKPGGCPNSFNRNSNGVLPVAMLGTATFDVADVDLSTLAISRADGVGGSVGPNEGPPGPHTTYGDVATPFEGQACGCHALDGDGFMDISMKFRTSDVVNALELGDLPSGDLVELVVSAVLFDGTEVEGSDCVRLVPPGTPPGVLAVSSNAYGAWSDAYPPDLILDGGGFGDYQRNYPVGTVVILSAEYEHQNRVFRGWRLNGALLIQQLSIPITVNGDVTSVEAVYSPGPPIDGSGIRPDVTGDDRSSPGGFGGLSR